ncbi:CPBP family intramembrane glutamic endopeptidase [Candidatus Amarolinea aalborgensis]|uniref:CPBP family intramembrane glutamic endopeptidase n=1 Tax=Candidatus Amarolinea aalborgensis TaxID=2249329 RepID=UPI003BF97ED2
MNQSTIGTTDTFADTPLQPNWRHVGAFLGLTFGLTWLLDLALYLRGGLATAGVTTILQLQMLLPAFSAIVLGLFFFRESPIHRDRRAGRGRWFYYYFLALTVVYALGALGVWLAPDQPALKMATSLIPLVFSFLGLLLLVALRAAAGREAMAQVGLAGGNWQYWLSFGLAIVAWFVLQAALNAVTGLGGSRLTPLPSVPGLDATAMLIVGALQTVLLGPILGLVITFGEEYGWRGYLQSELFKLGRVRGVLLLGVIWGAWHWPLILMGYNYPGHPLLGLALMTLYTTGLGIVLSYAVLKSSSVLLASFLHALTNQVAAFIIVVGFTPHDSAFSFFIGVYGIATLAVAASLILRDPIWRGEGSSLA